MSMSPVFIINRNRVTTTKQLVDWLLKAKTQRIVIVDNASTYPALLEYYKNLPEGVEMLPLGRNIGRLSFWEAGIDKLQSGPYIVTDSDVVPADICPLDLIDKLESLLRTHVSYQKIGVSIRLDNLPETPWREGIIEGQQQYWKKKVGQCWDAPVDTTFAIYRSGWVDPEWGRAIRTDAPYLIEHRPWYVWPLDEEEKYYRQHDENRTSMIEGEPYFRYK